jgi:type IV pilus assembly protein PilN
MVLGVLILTLVGMGVGYFWLRLNNRIDELNRSKAASEAKIREQDNMLREVSNIEAERKQVSEKIAIIEQLKKNQGGPVRLLDEISNCLPPGVNLVSLTEKGGQVDIAGTAFSNNDIVRFVDNLKATQYFADVFLIESRQVVIEGTEAYNYKLQFRFKGAS